MKQTNLSIFIPHNGCPNICSFCNQRFISGKNDAPTLPEVERLLAAQQPILEKAGNCAEIAFFGGSFTAIDRDYMCGLLETASRFINEFPAQYVGIRCSTRPDCIDEEILTMLKKYGTTAIELGAQSMDDEVLAANRRGHTAQDVENASLLIKQYNISLGLQMMTGLYKDTPQKCRMTAERFIGLRPDTVRIYPTVILHGTELDNLKNQGVYDSFDLETTINLCADLLESFTRNNIKVIRMGLHASDGVEREMTGGIFHPAFGELVESRLFLRKMQAEMTAGNSYAIFTDAKNVSKINGQKSFNRRLLAQSGITYKIITDGNPPFEIKQISQEQE